MVPPECPKHTRYGVPGMPPVPGMPQPLSVDLVERGQTLLFAERVTEFRGAQPPDLFYGKAIGRMASDPGLPSCIRREPDRIGAHHGFVLGLFQLVHAQ
jgi:hypothetical protein